MRIDLEVLNSFDFIITSTNRERGRELLTLAAFSTLPGVRSINLIGRSLRHLHTEIRFYECVTGTSLLR